MRDLFPGFYRPSEEEFHRVWQEGIFVLDTNVLLNLYRYPEEAQRVSQSHAQYFKPSLDS
jgi:hypothetical protein